MHTAEVSDNSITQEAVLDEEPLHSIEGRIEQSYSPEQMSLAIEEKLNSLRLEAERADEDRRNIVTQLTAAGLRREAEDGRAYLGRALVEMHQVLKHAEASAAGILLESGALEVLPREQGIYRFEDLDGADLDAECLRRGIEVARENFVRILLGQCRDVAALQALEERFPMAHWGTKDFFEFSNRYRLFDAPEEEVRLFEAAPEGDFRRAPRSREFYALALIKQERNADAISVCDALIDEGYGNGLVWSIRADALLGRGDAGPEAERAAAESCYRGFQESGSSFPALEWAILTLKERRRAEDRRDMLRKGGAGDEDGRQSLEAAEQEIAALDRLVANQQTLIDLALKSEGAEESLDYWKHVGRLELACMKGDSIEAVKPILAQAFQTGDAAFKFDIAIERIRAIREALGDGGGHADAVRAALEEGRTRFIEGHKRKGAALDEEYRTILEAPPQTDIERYKRNTINFLALLGSITPQYIQGGIGRAGARVPDTMINRQDEANFAEIITRLGVSEEDDPWRLHDVIEDFVRGRLGVDELQSLKAELHQRFDLTSDGVILLSGIDPRIRKGTRSITNLSGSLLMGMGDCRETLYAMGALFAVQTRMRVGRGLRDALACLEAGDQEGFERITTTAIPGILRYQLRGEHAGVYVSSIAMNGKYDIATVAPDSDMALHRPYGINEFRRGENLTRYEIENAVLRVTYADGTERLLFPKDPDTGRWAPHAHIPGQDGQSGLPLIPDSERMVGLELFNLVEDHTYSTLHDQRTGAVAFADGFYDQRRGGPYAFGSGAYRLEDLGSQQGLVRAGTRKLAAADGSVIESPVYTKALGYSKTDYQPSLGEGDIPGRIRIMGRSFEVDVIKEIFLEGSRESVVPKVMKQIFRWYRQRHVAPHE